MRALSLFQPWATLVISGAKRIETRSWHPWPKQFEQIQAAGGRIAIHAGKEWTKALAGLCQQEPFKAALIEAGYGFGVFSAQECPLPRGLLLGTVRLLACEPSECFDGRGSDPQSLCDRERAFGDYRPGRWAWLLAGPRPLAVPIPYAGRQGLFNLPDDITQILEGA